MNAFAITNKGIEHIAAMEIKELLGVPAAEAPGVALFEYPSLIGLCRLAYQAQSLSRVCHLFAVVEFDGEADLLHQLKKVDVAAFLKKGVSFAVRCSHDSSSLSGQDISCEAGDIFSSSNAHVNLTTPDYLLLLHIVGNTCYVGLDVCSFDLGKRQYRVFTHIDSVKATIAYAMLRIAGYDAGKALLDPFCGGGTICIEAALFVSKFSPHYFTKEGFAFHHLPGLAAADVTTALSSIDKAADVKKKTDIIGYDTLLRFVKASQKNAKIAGIDKSISFSRVDVDWLDTKVKEHSVDCIVTYPPVRTNANAKAVDKVYRELFHQAEYVLKKDGRIVILTSAPAILLPLAPKFNFLVKSQYPVMQGKKEMSILVLYKH